ncbi:MAG: hypothetical protein V2I66_16780 [Halieaceae bacterium]|jgi:hypothetical protein|nr:hypothetical protein [Halieaceae bacterium]
MSNEKIWNSLEVSKLIISVLTPLLLFWLGNLVSDSTKQTERALKEIEEIKEVQKNNQLAVQNLAKRIYERRSRAELLASSLKRDVSLEEIVKRKGQYDEAYFQWNRDHQANLLLVRNVLGEKQYSDFESMIEFHLVGKIFAPLDSCLTKAYDYRITQNKSGKEILNDCSVSTLLQQALDCGYALTDELFKLTEQNGKIERMEASSIVAQRCPG